MWYISELGAVKIQSVFSKVSCEKMEHWFILSFWGFKIEADVGINKGSIPVWIFGVHFVLCTLKVQIKYSPIQ